MASPKFSVEYSEDTYETELFDDYSKKVMYIPNTELGKLISELTKIYKEKVLGA